MSEAVEIDTMVFTDLNKFSEEAAKKVAGIDVASLLSLRGFYLKQLYGGIIVKIIDYDVEPNKILIFHDDATLVYTFKPVDNVELARYGEVLRKPNGLTTILTLLVIGQSVDSFNARRERLAEEFKNLESNFDEEAHGSLTRRYEEYYDRLEDLRDLIIKLEETRFPQVEVTYAPFDYSILLSELSNLIDRAKTRIAMLADMAFNYEMKVSRQLNRRIEDLSDVVKRLTALTVILMIPNIIAGHFGMNFRYMPELEIAWAYPTVVASQIILSVGILLLFRKKKWI